MRNAVLRSGSWLLALLVPVVVSAQRMLEPNASFVRWARANAVPLRPVDEPYTDSAYDFLRPLVGDARVLSLGEMIHGAHEPLAFRNQVVRYAVTRLGFTAVGIESGFTEGLIVDRFVQGGAGNIDSVVRAGFTSGFNRLGEERDLVVWMRDYNAHAERKVHFYGLDVPGDVGGYDGAPATMLAAIAYLELVAPSIAVGVRSRLGPLTSRFTMDGYPKYSPAEREQLRIGLDALERALLADSSRYIRASSPIEYARAVRTAWNAQRLRESLMLRSTDASGNPGAIGPRVLEAIRLRDSVMFENARWALAQQGTGGRMVVFAHNGHAMNVPLVFPAIGPPMTLMGQRLRAWLGPRLAIIGTSTSKYVGVSTPLVDGQGKVTAGPMPSDISLFDVTLAQLGLGNYAIDLRTADRVPEVAAMLGAPWIARIHAFFQPMVPRDVADMFVVFDHVTASKDHYPPR